CSTLLESLVVLIMVCILYILTFFFQAEDGIRDRNVTEVQTCALPISAIYEAAEGQRTSASTSSMAEKRHTSRPFSSIRVTLPNRSEERRVGKECRSRRWPDQ